MLNIEVYPDPSKGHRLPLCRGRTMLLDKPLPLVKRRGKQVQDVVGYMAWLENPARQYMAKNEIADFVVQNLDLSRSSDNPEKKRPREAKPGDEKPGHPVAQPMKGRTREAIVGFWLRGEPGHFAHLNAAIAVTLRALCFEGLSQDKAVAVVISYVDELTNLDLSSRLANNKDAIYQVVRRDANRIWADNGGQVDSRSSSEKWKAIVRRWQLIGFLVSDKATWRHEGPLGTVVDCGDFEFTEEERRLLIDEMAPILVGKKQALKEAKQQEVIKAVKYFLRYVKCHSGEIPLNALPVVLKDCDLKLGMDGKKRAFLNLLRKWEWIYVRAEYWHPLQYGKAGRGRARAYGIGPAMAGKFGNPSLIYTPQRQRTYILSATFPESLPDEVGVPCFEDQFDGLKGDSGVENHEVLIDLGGKPTNDM